MGSTEVCSTHSPSLNSSNDSQYEFSGGQIGVLIHRKLPLVVWLLECSPLKMSSCSLTQEDSPYPGGLGSGVGAQARNRPTWPDVTMGGVYRRTHTLPQASCEEYQRFSLNNAITK